MDKYLFMRSGPAIWPLDVRSIGFEKSGSHPVTQRPEGAPFAIFMWTLDGSGYVSAAEGKYPLQKGRVFLLPPNVPHEYGPTPGSQEWRLEWFTLDGSLCDVFLKSLEIHKLTVGDTGLPAEVVFQRLIESSREPGMTGSMERAQYAVRIIYETCARLNKKLSNPKNPRFQDLIKSAAQAVGYEFNVDYLARQSGLTRSHFSRTFTAETGMTPAQFVMETKLAKARTLLLNTKNSVKAIAVECGFFDTAHFSRQFLRITGLTPTAFRNQQPV